MIGHYLLTLTPEKEARVLTQPFQRLLQSRGAAPELPRDCRCLVLTATDGAAMFGSCWGLENWQASPGYRYEDLAQRFGEARVNAAIRNRILAHQARRALTAPRSGMPVGGGPPSEGPQT